MPRVRLLVVLLALALAIAPTPSVVAANTAGLVISQVYGGGGNAGAPFTHDFVELFNRGTSTVDVSGWTVQYATATGTTWSATALAGTIAPGRHLLVALADGTNGAALPAPDVTGSTNLSATGGKLALVRGTAALTCGAIPGSCAAEALVEDLVGYGGATDYEGTGPAPATSATAAALRADDGCADTGQNASDFASAAPAPRNSATAAHPCSEPPPPPPETPTASGQATVDVDVQPVLSLSLERTTISFGTVATGTTPAPVSERVTVLSNDPSGYALTVGRSAFAPADLPLALQASAPAGAELAPSLAGGALVAVPIAPSALTVGTTSAISGAAGDVWPTNVGFTGPLPSVPPGRYTATLTYTVIGR